MPFQLSSNDGEVMIDHRASPGIPEATANKMVLPPEMVREGSQMHAATMGCPHCGGCVVMNPMRQRERAHCFQCHSYICDWCDAARREPDYQHRTIKEL